MSMTKKTIEIRNTPVRIRLMRSLRWSIVIGLFI